MTHALAQIPESATAQAAAALLVETSPQHLVEHCLRTYQFGLALAVLDGHPPDLEVAFVAAALHDLGLTDRFDGPDSFEDEGAAATATFLADRDFSPGRTAHVLDAIRLHLQIESFAHPQPEVALVSRGAVLDVIGLGKDRLDPTFVNAVLKAHPRLGFKVAITSLIQSQAERKPSSTIAGHVEHGFLSLISKADFAE